MSVVIDGCGFLGAKPGQECLVWDGETSFRFVQMVSPPPKWFVGCLLLFY